MAPCDPNDHRSSQNLFCNLYTCFTLQRCDGGNGPHQTAISTLCNPSQQGSNASSENRHFSDLVISASLPNFITSLN
jgi:hypothetical protein